MKIIKEKDGEYLEFTDLEAGMKRDFEERVGWRTTLDAVMQSVMRTAYQASKAWEMGWEDMKDVLVREGIISKKERDTVEIIWYPSTKRFKVKR